ncbi:MAG: hypothetical protein ACOCZ5_00865 [bacterium]
MSNITLRTTKGSPLTHEELDNNFNACLGIHNLLHVEDRKPTRIHGGTFTSGAWRTRDLNTIIINNIPGSSLDNNQITLPVGQYWVEGSVPARGVDAHKARLRQVSPNSITLLNATTESTTGATAVSTKSVISGFIDIEQTSIVELQHINNTTATDWGFGAGMLSETSEINIFSQIKIWKI